MARKVTHLVLHHTASAHATVKEIDRQHRARGFAGIGYHAVIGNGRGIPDGHISAGRPESKDGAGVAGNNRNKLHVCLVGQFAAGYAGFTGEPTHRQMAALGHWLVVNGVQYRRGITYPKVVGHREIALPRHPTACPGDLDLDRIRHWYEEMVDYQRLTGKVPVSLAKAYWS